MPVSRACIYRKPVRFYLKLLTEYFEVIWDIAYHSGMTSQADFQACIETNSPAGIVAGGCTALMLFGSIPRFVRNGGHLFVDSGAFTAFRLREPMDWGKVISKYRIIISTTDGSPQVSIVAPDVVGNQEETIELWKQYQMEIKEWIASGVRVIVPLQAGALRADELLSLAVDMFGTDKFCAGIPSNEAALSVDACRTLSHNDFHILGRVVMSPEVKEKVDALLTNNQNARLTSDANWLRSRTREISAARLRMQTTLASSRRTKAVVHLLSSDRYKSKVLMG